MTQAPVPRQESWWRARLMGYHVLQALLYGTKYLPNLLPTLNQFYERLLFERAPAQDRPLTAAQPHVDVIDHSDRVFNFDCLFRQYVTEWAVEWRHSAPEALRQLKHLIDEDQRRGADGNGNGPPPLIRAHFPVEIRFVQGDRTWLSPAYGHDAVCYIGIIMYRPYGRDVFPRRFFWDAYEAIMLAQRGRPHWAKAHGLHWWQLDKLYPKFADFCRMRDQLDPDGRFLNAYSRRHLRIQARL